LWVSDDEGVSFEHLQEEVSMTCLNAIDGELWACSSSLNGPWDVGRSADGGLQFESVFALDDLVGPVECPDDVVCEVENADLARDYALDVCLSPPCAPVPPENPGGGCSVSASQNRGILMLLAGIGLLFIRRRRR
ncbi:MAG: MYXO-CTERM domain-containing protein, partial [Polyangiales bacterium]